MSSSTGTLASDSNRKQPTGKSSGAAKAPAPASKAKAATDKSVAAESANVKPAAAKPVAPKVKVEPRRIRLVLSRVDPWSVMKLSFLLSVVLGIATVVAVAFVYSVLNGMGVFNSVQEFISNVVGSTSEFSILGYVEFSKVISFAVIVAVVNVLIITALSTIGSLCYNIAAALLGGLHVTLTDD
ncbi:DUF3566 domain-containing protein [Micrococcales bacterium 31B]|nr:DUF3566 domain-containing protein [Micrococcales bacterium 31B]